MVSGKIQLEVSEGSVRGQRSETGQSEVRGQ